ncbi:hypothetical protein CSUB01_05923 [Colletotrichum sublineola]|uniref:Uncharacterized protein n=1 Tax=Colletotrichum sublineola TaxID=1173701 RepID=A0A066XP65_COLSU|nr:hypothetical protein CSUB01_05923 [Colletotrichum sublineola]
MDATLPNRKQRTTDWCGLRSIGSVLKGAAPSARLSIGPHPRGHLFGARRQTAVCSTFDGALTPSPREPISSSPTIQNHSFATNARHIQPQSTQLTPSDLSRTTPTPREKPYRARRRHLSLYNPAVAHRSPAVLPSSCRCTRLPAQAKPSSLKLASLGTLFRILALVAKTPQAYFSRATLPEAACMHAMGSGRTCPQAGKAPVLIVMNPPLLCLSTVKYAALTTTSYPVSSYIVAALVSNEHDDEKKEKKMHAGFTINGNHATQRTPATHARTSGGTLASSHRCAHPHLFGFSSHPRRVGGVPDIMSRFEGQESILSKVGGDKDSESELMQVCLLAGWSEAQEEEAKKEPETFAKLDGCGLLEEVVARSFTTSTPAWNAIRCQWYAAVVLKILAPETNKLAG